MKILEKIRWRLACYRLLFYGRFLGNEYVIVGMSGRPDENTACR